MVLIRSIISIFLWLYTSTFAYTQQDELGNWIILSAKNDISNNFSISTTIHVRNYEWYGNAQQQLYLLGTSYKGSWSNTIGGGYGHLRTQSFSKTEKELVNYEHRIWQNFAHLTNWKRKKVINKFTAEQRWLSFLPEDPVFKYRVRYGIFFTLPLQKTLLKSFYLTLSQEIFMHIEDKPFDQNRAYIGLGFMHSKNLKFQLGYLNHQFQDTNFHRWQFNVILRTMFIKKE